jgi:hypothetical protein
LLLKHSTTDKTRVWKCIIVPEKRYNRINKSYFIQLLRQWMKHFWQCKKKRECEQSKGETRMTGWEQRPFYTPRHKAPLCILCALSVVWLHRIKCSMFNIRCTLGVWHQLRTRLRPDQSDRLYRIVFPDDRRGLYLGRHTECLHCGCCAHWALFTLKIAFT